MNEFHALLTALLREQLNDRLEQLATGQAEDFAAYKYLCGEIEGLNIALGNCEIVRKKITGEA